MAPAFLKQQFLHIFLAVYLLWSFAEVFYKATREKGGLPLLLMPGWYGIIFYAVVDHIRLRWTLFFTEAGPVSYAAIVLFAAASLLRLSAAKRMREHIGGEAPLSDGLFRQVRYPVYTGYLVQLAAVALMFGSWGAVLLTVLAGGMTVYIASGQDDIRQLERYGTVFEKYRAATARVIPFIW